MSDDGRPDLGDPDFDRKMAAFVKAERAKLPPGHRAPRPRDAATIIIRRQVRGATEVLMGRRHHAHKFMPNMFVFPGGRVDLADARVFPALKLAPEAAVHLVGPKGVVRARAIALAGIRETFEEAGIAIGRPHSGRPFATKNPVWKSFVQRGFTPALDALEVIARAITPPFEPRRFDTWFFSVDIEKTPAAAAPVAAGSGELEELQWVAIDDTGSLKLPPITHRALATLKQRLDAGPHASQAVPFMRYSRGRYGSAEL